MDKKEIDRRGFIAELGFGLGGAGLLLSQLDVRPAFGATAESSKRVRNPPWDIVPSVRQA